MTERRRHSELWREQVARIAERETRLADGDLEVAARHVEGRIASGSVILLDVLALLERRIATVAG